MQALGPPAPGSTTTFAQARPMALHESRAGFGPGDAWWCCKGLVRIPTSCRARSAWLEDDSFWLPMCQLAVVGVHHPKIVYGLVTQPIGVTPCTVLRPKIAHFARMGNPKFIQIQQATGRCVQIGQLLRICQKSKNQPGS